MRSRILKEYAKQVAAGFHPKIGVDQYSHLALGLCGEAGEVADYIKKSQYLGSNVKEIDSADIAEELADVLWYLQNLATLVGLSIEELALININKLYHRRGGPYNIDTMLRLADPNYGATDVPPVTLGGNENQVA